MKIDKKLISDLAKLAKLNFDEKSSKAMENDLKKIIGFVNKLSEIDTDNVDPLIYLSEEINVLRKDNLTSNLSQQEALKNAPKKDSDYILVPKVIKK
ncbi:MAG: Asp-tRNA(Asn)/Glu-tRNA(Gln) amidotransferase GatCAB subunit C [Flavobacteriales bacterium]|nr:Asp-tRNA(Asn)/Glu-tRNA(Gln) amidotransferase GatCAB subunit C [Flavobacteriales bacterium]|tara:strand:+ start:242 stop:532 length:291 start_codon:yes stop_codon:yes gene_type:complete